MNTNYLNLTWKDVLDISKCGIPGDNISIYLPIAVRLHYDYITFNGYVCEVFDEISYRYTPIKIEDVK
jgi:hypothetical protein